MVRIVTATVDPELVARITSRRPLVYDSGADATLDRPAHVRAASGIAVLGSSLAVVQDDASFVALVDLASGRIDAVTLPPSSSGARQFDDIRGNKSEKLDLEGCLTCVIDGEDCLVAFGSGSTPMRERAAIVTRSGSVSPRVVALPSLYTALRSATEFSGSELNIEGAVLVGSAVRLVQRGNGAPRGGLRPVNATADVPLELLLDEIHGRPVDVRLERVLQYDLGNVRGVPWTFTDATLGPGGTVLFAAAAEDSPDAVRDGPVLGAALGIFDGDGAARLTPLTDASGQPVHDKVEGIVLDPGNARRLYVVIDADDPEQAAEMCEVEIEGSWGDR